MAGSMTPEMLRARRTMFIATVSFENGELHRFDVQAEDLNDAESLVSEEITSGEMVGAVVESLEEGSVYAV